MPRPAAEAQLLAMIESMRHEPSYRTGTWIHEGMGIYLGWAERSGSGNMPLRNEKGDVILCFSGEDFSEPAEDQLKGQGNSVGKGSSYLVRMYEGDPTFPASLNGRFHGFACNERNQTALLFNDRYGMHRIYYHAAKEAFYFAAEAKAILKVRPELRRADARGLGEYISCGCVLENRTLFPNVHVLPPGSAWVFRNGTLSSKGSYFRPQEWEGQELLELDAYYEQLRDVFARTLPRYFRGKETIGMSLTGGLDSRMILAWQKPAPGSLPCYSFGSMFRDCQDVVLARRVAKACGQSHRVIPVGKEFLSNFGRYAERSVYLTDGCLNVSHSADLYVNERAAQIAPVRMTGNYGGEVLRRVRAFKPVRPANSLFADEVMQQVTIAESTYTGLLRSHPLSFAVFQQAPWHHYGLLSLEQTQVSMRTPFLDNDLVRTVYRAPDIACTNSDISRRIIADGDAGLTRIRTDRGPISGLNGWRASGIRGLIDFTIKAEYAYDYGMPQWVARVDRVLSPFHLERLFLGRHKFYHYRVWYRDTLAEYLRSMLLDSRTLSRPYLQGQTVRDMVNGHLKGDRNYTSEIHTVLTLELISRLFLDSQ